MSELIERPKSLYIVCTGLGNVMRGYESFVSECFEALKDEPSLSVHLFKGGGKSTRNETVVWNLPRSNKVAKFVGRLLHVDSYQIEQLTFMLAFLPSLILGKPEVVFLPDRQLGRLLIIWKKISKQKFNLIFHNGVPATPPYAAWDHIHEMTPRQYSLAVSAGERPENLSLIPLGRNISRDWIPPSIEDRKSLRLKLGLPVDKQIALSVAAINTAHKRIDYLIREVGAIKGDRPFLVMLGYQEHEAAVLRKLAIDLLGQDGFVMTAVNSSQVQEYYRSADLFVLTSLSEGFGLVMVEALSYGLPCIVHDYDTSRFVLEDDGTYGDFREDGTLTALLEQAKLWKFDIDGIAKRHDHAYSRFSWSTLTPAYVEMIHRAAPN